MRIRSFGLALFLLAATAWVSTAAAEPRVALVIGNSEYGPEIGKLKNPANDAKLMAETLKGLGFSVDLVIDADQKAMKRAVKGFGAKLKQAGSEATGLFYYAGHGVRWKARTSSCRSARKSRPRRMSRSNPFPPTT